MLTPKLAASLSASFCWFCKAVSSGVTLGCPTLPDVISG